MITTTLTRIKLILKRKALLILILGGLLLANNTELNAQRKRVLNLPNYDDKSLFHFGFILGINHMLFTIKTIDNLPEKKWLTEQSPDVFGDSLYVYSVTTKPTPGFSVGILANMHLGRNADLRFIPSLAFGERLVYYNILRYKDGEPIFVEVEKSITSTIIEIPLELRYKSKRLNNYRMYVLGGLKYSLDLASQKKDKNNTSTTNLKLYRNDLSAEVGAGAEFYTTYFKFGVEAKMGYGLRNLRIPEDNLYSGSISTLRSKVFLLSFTFE